MGGEFDCALCERNIAETEERVTSKCETKSPGASISHVSHMHAKCWDKYCKQAAKANKKQFVHVNLVCPVAGCLNALHEHTPDLPERKPTAAAPSGGRTRASNDNEHEQPLVKGQTTKGERRKHKVDLGLLEEVDDFEGKCVEPKADGTPCGRPISDMELGCCKLHIAAARRKRFLLNAAAEAKSEPEARGSSLLATAARPRATAGIGIAIPDRPPARPAPAPAPAATDGGGTSAGAVTATPTRTVVPAPVRVAAWAAARSGVNAAKAADADKSNYIDPAELTECPICLDTLGNIRFTPCGHTACDECIDSWTVANTSFSQTLRTGHSLATCPLCRAHVQDTVAIGPPSTPAAAAPPNTTTAAARPNTSTAAARPSTTTAAERPNTAAAAEPPNTTTAAARPNTTAAAERPSTAAAAERSSTAAAAVRPSTAAAAVRPSTSTTAASSEIGAAAAEREAREEEERRKHAAWMRQQEEERQAERERGRSGKQGKGGTGAAVEERERRQHAEWMRQQAAEAKQREEREAREREAEKERAREREEKERRQHAEWMRQQAAEAAVASGLGGGKSGSNTSLGGKSGGKVDGKSGDKSGGKSSGDKGGGAIEGKDGDGPRRPSATPSNPSIDTVMQEPRLSVPARPPGLIGESSAAAAQVAAAQVAAAPTTLVPTPSPLPTEAPVTDAPPPRGTSAVVASASRDAELILSLRREVGQLRQALGASEVNCTQLGNDVAQRDQTVAHLHTELEASQRQCAEAVQAVAVTAAEAKAATALAGEATATAGHQLSATRSQLASTERRLAETTSQLTDARVELEGSKAEAKRSKELERFCELMKQRLAEKEKEVGVLVAAAEGKRELARRCESMEQELKEKDTRIGALVAEAKGKKELERQCESMWTELKDKDKQVLALQRQLPSVDAPAPSSAPLGPGSSRAATAGQGGAARCGTSGTASAPPSSGAAPTHRPHVHVPPPTPGQGFVVPSTSQPARNISMNSSGPPGGGPSVWKCTHCTVENRSALVWDPETCTHMGFCELCQQPSLLVRR